MTIIKKLTALAVLLLLFTTAFPLFAAESKEETVPSVSANEENDPGQKKPSLRIEGPASAYAGDTLTLNIFIDGTGHFLRGVQTEPDFDTAKMFFSDASPANGWKVLKDARIIATDENFDLPVSEDTRILTIVFLLKDDLTEGDTVSVRLHNTLVTDWENVTGQTDPEELPLEDAVYTLTILPPRSSDASLHSLSVSEGVISPAFNPGILQYTVTVPYSVRYATVNAHPNDEKATVRVSGNTLQVGSNTVTVSVSAENGIVWLYKIIVTREQNPGYVPDSNTGLADIRVSSGTVSPKPEEHNDVFVVYLPFETDKLTVTPVPASKTAKFSVVTANLTVGINEIPFSVTAEDGTVTEYLLYAVRHPAFEKIEDIPIFVPDTEPETEPETTAEHETESETLPETVSETDPYSSQTALSDTAAAEDPTKNGIAVFWLLPAVIFSLIAGYGICVLTRKQK